MNHLVAAGCLVALGALTALVAQRGVSAYHDGVRPLLPEYRRGELTGPELFRKAWSMSAGFVAWFAVPFTLVTRIPTSHLLFLPAEVVGVRQASRKSAALVGAACGLGVFGILAVVRAGFSALPATATHSLHLIGEPLRHVLFLFPIVAAFYQWGLRRAAVIAVVVLAVVIGASHLGQLPGHLSAEGLGLLVGTVVIVVAALRNQRRNAPPVPELFVRNLRGLRRSALPALVLVGGLAGALSQSALLAGEPAAALLLGAGHRWDAAAVGVFSAVAFAPMVVRSSATSGAYSTQGYPDWVLSAGLVSGSPLIGAVAGAGALAVEVLAAPRVLAALHRFPDLAELGSAMRQAMAVVIDLAVLVGSIAAATAVQPTVGAAIVVGLFIWNEASQRRLMPVAVGPIGVLLTGLAAALFSLGG